MISKFAISLTLYFDEIIIQNPFLNPASVKPEFNPVHSPHQYKQQTLKNIILLLTLAPFIEAGYINFIPDPCVFDGHLRRQMFSMAEKRSQNHQISEKESSLMTKLFKEDFMRLMWMLPKVQQKIQIQRVIPDLSEKQVENVLKYIEVEKQNDPFTLLQDDVFGEEGGQFTMGHLTPNFEMALYLSQITGSLLLTDNHYRWEEMTSSQNKEDGMVVYNWSDISSCINDLEYVLNANPESAFQLRNSGKLGKLRKATREIYSAIQDDEEPTKFLMERLKQQFIEAYEISKKEIGDGEQHSFNSKFHCIIPMGGIVHNNVQRMLLSCGSDNHLKNVPMAIFVENS